MSLYGDPTVVHSDFVEVAVFTVIVGLAVAAVIASSRGGSGRPAGIVDAGADGVRVADGRSVPWSDIDELEVCVGGRSWGLAGRRTWQLRLRHRDGSALVVDGRAGPATQVLAESHQLGAVDHDLVREYLGGGRPGRAVCWSRVD